MTTRESGRRVSMPMPLTVLAVAVFGLAAGLLALMSWREIALSAND